MKGVTFHKPSNSWVVYARLEGNSVYLGVFKDKKKADKILNLAYKNVVPYKNNSQFYRKQLKKLCE